MIGICRCFARVDVNGSGTLYRSFARVDVNGTRTLYRSFARVNIHVDVIICKVAPVGARGSLRQLFDMAIAYATVEGRCEGKSSFHVLIFDKTTTEIQYPVNNNCKLEDHQLEIIDLYEDDRNISLS
uniref:Uncharacterized protein n=1 Tax=Quercus lobata TaxID=97700 RepID=A0A7N2MH75_QUELO